MMASHKFYMEGIEIATVFMTRMILFNTKQLADKFAPVP